MNLGRFCPIPVQSGRFSPGRFGPIFRLSRFSLTRVGRFGNFQGVSFPPSLKGEPFRPDLFILRKQVRY